MQGVNQYRRIVLIVAFLLAAAMGLFPPWLYTCELGGQHQTVHAGYRSLFALPPVGAWHVGHAGDGEWIIDPDWSSPAIARNETPSPAQADRLANLTEEQELEMLGRDLLDRIKLDSAYENAPRVWNPIATDLGTIRAARVDSTRLVLQWAVLACLAAMFFFADHLYQVKPPRES